MTDKKTTETKTEPTVTVDGRTITWGYSKKVQVQDFEPVEISLHMTDTVPEGEEVIDVVVQSEQVFDMLKAEVWGAHDLEYGFTEAGRPELVVQVPTPLQQQVAQVQAAAPVPAVAPAVAAVPGSLVGVYPEIPTFCKDCGKTEFWDNRAQNDDKIGKGAKIGPDFKCKACEGGSGTQKPIYRPGSYDYNQAVGKAPAAPATMQPPTPLTPANISAPAPDEAPF